VLFVEHEDVVGAFASRRPDQAFNMAVLPGRTEGRRPVPDAHRPDAGLRFDRNDYSVPHTKVQRPQV
jgi:hypothetical protein